MTEKTTEYNDALPYVIPMAGFLALTTLEGYLPTAASRPSPTWYPIAYTIKVVVVAALAWACRSTWRDLAPRPGVGALILAIGLGLLVTLAWVGLDGHYPTLSFLGKRTEFDPRVLRGPAYVGFLTVRMLGLVVLVPLMEELFWRSFLLRWMIEPNFLSVPIGKVTPMAALVTSGLFALAHPEWLPALLTGLAWAWLLWRTRNLAACTISHAVANLALGVYVIATGDWKFW
jgi:CAAX prenyl protease-like protein